MPWSPGDVNRHKKGLNSSQKKQWSAIANAILSQTGDEGKAIRIANSKVGRSRSVKPKNVTRKGGK